MTALTYNVALLVGVLLVFAGLCLWSLALALAVTGALVILLTLFAAIFLRAR